MRPAARPQFPEKDDEDQSFIAKVLAGGYAWLQFPESLEAEFRANQLQVSRRWVRLSLQVVLSTTIGFAVIDHWVIHARGSVPDVVRFGLQLPTLLLCLLSTSKRLYARVYVPTIQIATPLFGLGTVIMACYARAEDVPLVGARLLLVAFFTYFMLGLRMPQALRSNLIVFIGLLTAAMMGFLPAEPATYLAFALFCANVIGGAGAYALEHANRTAFLEQKLLIEMAALDGLTRLLNRQTFETRVHEVWNDAMLRQHSVTVLMVDVDDFKLYNDCCGHHAGDDCLRRVATAVRAAVAHHPADLVARYGGEELIAVLVDRSNAEAERAAQRIVEHIRALEIPHTASTVAATVSVSVGAATQYPASTASYSALAKLADNALYAAKRQGRNRYIAVEAHTGSYSAARETREKIASDTDVLPPHAVMTANRPVP
jgi:diguanylate cyclase (GGDEF)-like protein